MKPMRVSLLLWAGWEWTGKHSIHLFEPLDAGEVPPDAKAHCFDNKVTFYAPGGNTVYARDVQYHHLVQVGQECCLCVDGHWFSVTSGRVIYKKGVGWCMQWLAYDNTRWTQRLNEAEVMLKGAKP